MACTTWLLQIMQHPLIPYDLRIQSIQSACKIISRLLMPWLIHKIRNRRSNKGQLHASTFSMYIWLFFLLYLRSTSSTEQTHSFSSIVTGFFQIHHESKHQLASLRNCLDGNTNMISDHKTITAVARILWLNVRAGIQTKFRSWNWTMICKEVIGCLADHLYRELVFDSDILSSLFHHLNANFCCCTSWIFYLWYVYRKFAPCTKFLCV